MQYLTQLFEIVALFSAVTAASAVVCATCAVAIVRRTGSRVVPPPIETYGEYPTRDFQRRSKSFSG